MKYTIQEEIGKHCFDQAVQLVREGKTFVFVIDNIDWTLKVHDMRSDRQNTSVHAVATSRGGSRLMRPMRMHQSNF